MPTALPAATDFTGASITEAQFKTALTNMRTFLSDLLGADGVEATALAAIMAPFSAVNAQTIAYALVAGDRGKVIYYTGSGGVALTLPVTSTTDFGVGYSCSVVNLSTGTITLTRSSTDTIDGSTTVALEAGSSTILFIAASGKWVTIGKASVNGAFRSKQIFTSTGTWTKPSNLKRVKVTVVGGGGEHADPQVGQQVVDLRHHRAELLKHEEDDAVMDQPAPVASAHEVALLVGQVRLR